MYLDHSVTFFFNRIYFSADLFRQTSWFRYYYTQITSYCEANFIIFRFISLHFTCWNIVRECWKESKPDADGRCYVWYATVGPRSCARGIPPTAGYINFWVAFLSALEECRDLVVRGGQYGSHSFYDVVMDVSTGQNLGCLLEDLKSKSYTPVLGMQLESDVWGHNEGANKIHLFGRKIGNILAGLGIQQKMNMPISQLCESPIALSWVSLSMRLP